MNLYPLKFRPIYKQRIWGGQKLREVFGRDIAADAKIGESWELADLPDDKSIIVNGDLAGLSLGQAVQRYPRQIAGSDIVAEPFPLLIKYLDAQDILSIQVHPDEKSCIGSDSGRAKTECWYIISAEPGAFIYKGLKKDVTKQQFAEAVRQGGVTDLLEKIYVSAGQCYYLPAGVVHSIGAGVFIAEIQTTSDTTYRIYDFDRLDVDGLPREIHLQKALECIKYEKAPEPVVTGENSFVLESRYFCIKKCNQAADITSLLPDGRMNILLITSGRGTITGQNFESLKFTAGDCLLIPAACSAVIKTIDQTDYLIVRI